MMIYEKLTSFLTRLLTFRDPHAKGHSNHVATLSSRLAGKIGMPSAEIEKLEFAAKFHDIGKLAVNEFIINKPGRFTEVEFLMVQYHAILGSSLIETLGLDAIIPAIIQSHHENFDGSGYPNKLMGDQIPLGARIIRITDTYDALTSNRAYHPAYERKDVLNIMEKEYNFFDPHLLEAFFTLDHME